MAHLQLDRLREVPWPAASPPPGEVYALLDAARDPRIDPILRRSLVDSCCLFAGDLPRELAEVAPYLVALGRESRLTAGLIEAGWGNSWSLFVRSTAVLRPGPPHP
jgi:hypothetical protein